MIDDTCKGCTYLGRSHCTSAGEPDICDYIGIVGHSRGCAAGAGCTAKKLVKGKRRQGVA